MRRQAETKWTFELEWLDGSVEYHAVEWIVFDADGIRFLSTEGSEHSIDRSAVRRTLVMRAVKRPQTKKK